MPDKDSVNVRLSLSLKEADSVSDNDAVSVRLLLVVRVIDTVSDIDSECVAEAVAVGSVRVSVKL